MNHLKEEMLLKSYKKEIVIPNLKLKNRIIMPPMASEGADEKGHVSQALLDYYSEKSKGGYFSMIITEHSYISKEGKASERQLSIADDSDIEGLKKLTDIIHENETIAIAQLSHAGGMAKREITGMDTYAPSFTKVITETEADREFTIDEIKVIVEKFRKASIRAIKAGYDGVEIHSAHRYLLNQFYSPLTNLRTDKYGGKISNRIKIHLEVIEAVRDAIGDDKPILLRLGAIDHREDGSTIEDAIYASKAFEEAGIDILDISGGLSGWLLKGREKEQGYFIDITEKLKKEVSIPIIMTGGITDINILEKFIKEDKADLIGVGRAVLKDSDWIKRAFE